MKRCVICKKEKLETEFNKHKNKKDGLQLHCIECNKEYSKEYYRNNKDVIKRCKTESQRRKRETSTQKMLEYLSYHPCVDCDNTDIRVLEFDHTGDKKANIARLASIGSNWEKIEKEIQKCEIRCANCHIIKTQKSENVKNKIFD